VSITYCLGQVVEKASSCMCSGKCTVKGCACVLTDNYCGPDCSCSCRSCRFTASGPVQSYSVFNFFTNPYQAANVMATVDQTTVPVTNCLFVVRGIARACLAEMHNFHLRTLK